MKTQACACSTVVGELRSEVKCDYLTAITSSIPTRIFRYSIITCLDTNVHVSVQTWLWPRDLGTNMCGHKRVWAQTCWGTIMCGHKLVWAQTCLGTNVCGHKHVWAQSCVGTNVCGHNRVGSIVWAQSCMGQFVWFPFERTAVKQPTFPKDYRDSRVFS